MKIVIQCAAKKKPTAGGFKMPDGRPVLFVAHPDKAPPGTNYVYDRPDDPSDNGQTWRDRLLTYNKDAGSNPMNFLPAYQLYANNTYRRLVEKFGIDSVFILSAGWGLISANFLTPVYDITFSGTAEPYKRRRKNEKYDDLCMIPDDGKRMVFLGGKDYLPMFCSLTVGLKDEKTIFYNSKLCPDSPTSFRLERYKTTTRTNWHYECANDLIDGKIGV